MKRVILVAAIALAGCSTTPPPIDIQTQCLPMVDYTKADQVALASELARMDAAGSFKIVLRVVGDYEGMRNADRACLAAKK